MARDKTTSNFPKAGDSEAEVANVSGEPSANTELRPRDGALDPAPPSEPPGHRTPVEVDAESSQLYDSGTRARARQVWSKAADQLGDPRSRTLLGNILGLDGDERDR